MTWTYDAEDQAVVNDEGEIVAELTRASARHGQLLAAAPDLRDALRWYEDFEGLAEGSGEIRTGSHREAALVAARAALAKCGQ